MLCASRFAHYIKVIVRDMVGTLETPAKIEQRLQAWLNGYVNSAVSAGPETRARQPLVAGRVTISERPDRPGTYGCTIHLQPHFQLDDVGATFRLVTEVVSPERRG
jgi:type VI secretion system protein ImpD/type VI secretion system protein ImpC